MTTNATNEELKKALFLVNEIFNDNIKFKDISQISTNRIRFTLTVNESFNEGSRRSREGRKISAACWHVHGQFFDFLFQINKDIVIRSQGRKITINGGNWQDWNMGSNYYYSQACECSGSLRNTSTHKLINQKYLTAECWLVQFNGLLACETCKFKNTSDCGGGEYLKNLKNKVAVN